MVQPAVFLEPGSFPELPGPAVGPKGPKIGQKPDAGFIIVSSLRCSTPQEESETCLVSIHKQM